MLDDVIGAGWVATMADVPNPENLRVTVSHGTERFGPVDTVVCSAGSGSI